MTDWNEPNYGTGSRVTGQVTGEGRRSAPQTPGSERGRRGRLWSPAHRRAVGRGQQRPRLAAALPGPGTSRRPGASRAHAAAGALSGAAAPGPAVCRGDGDRRGVPGPPRPGRLQRAPRTGWSLVSRRARVAPHAAEALGDGGRGRAQEARGGRRRADPRRAARPPPWGRDCGRLRPARPLRHKSGSSRPHAAGAHGDPRVSRRRTQGQKHHRVSSARAWGARAGGREGGRPALGSRDAGQPGARVGAARGGAAREVSGVLSLAARPNLHCSEAPAAGRGRRDPTPRLPGSLGWVVGGGRGPAPALRRHLPLLRPCSPSDLPLTGIPLLLSLPAHLPARGLSGMRRSPDVSPRRLSDISPQLRQLKYLVVDEAIKEDLKWSRSVEDLTSGPVGLTSIEERILRITGYYGYQPWATSYKSKTTPHPRPPVRLPCPCPWQLESTRSDAPSHPPAALPADTDPALQLLGETRRRGSPDLWEFLSRSLTPPPLPTHAFLFSSPCS